VDPERNRIPQVSGGFFGVCYERFLQMPVAVVLTVLWLGGMALWGSCALMLYTLGTLMLASVSGGA
jgi:ABC-type multidrug transport system permease subunit